MMLFRALQKNTNRVTVLATRKVLTVFAALAVGVSPLMGMADTARAVANCTTVFAGGTGLSTDPWKVASASQLSALRDCGTENTYFLQTQDISLATMNPWIPIASFAGNYDGDHFQISGLTINLPTVQYVGFFSKLTSSARIASMNLQVNVNGNYYAAGLAGENQGVISTSYVSGSISSTEQYTAGLVGYNSGRIESSGAWATIRSAAMAGGLVGLNQGIIRNSYSQGTIDAGDGGGLVGGQDGNYRAGYPDAIVGNSYSNVTVKSSVGGYGGGVLFRRMSKTTLEGNLFFEPHFGSGIASRFMGWDWVSPFVVPPEVFSKTTAEMKSYSTFGPNGGNWTIVDGWAEYNGTTQIWGICSGFNNGYPYLLWQNPTGTGCPKPGPPTNATASVGGTSVTLNWTAPSFSGSSTITGYTVTSSVGGKTCAAIATARTCTVSGLTTGQSYTFTVTANNSSGVSGVSNAVTVTPMVVPVEVLDGTPNAEVGDASSRVTWTNRVSANVTGYLVTSSPGGATCIAPTSSVSNPSCIVNGLTNGTSYTFTVKTTNAAGAALAASAASNAVTPLGLPSNPGLPTVSTQATQATLTWTAPLNNGGDVITEYTATSTPGSFSCVVSGLTCTISGLTNGTAYTFTVKAKNSLAYGAESLPSSPAIPRTIPGAPTSVSGSSSNAGATVTWTAPVDNGGDDVSEYQVRAYDSAGVSRSVCTLIIPSPSLACDVTGLTNGYPYRFGVYAYNSEGYGPRSVLSSSTIPLTKPGPPTSIQAGAGDQSAVVTWMAPVDNGGASLSTYLVTSNPGGHTCSTSWPQTLCFVGGLTNGQAYTFTVTARSTAFATVGESDASTASLLSTPHTTPDAPSLTSVTPGNDFLSVIFNAPSSDGGNPISSYEYSVDAGAHWIAFSSTSTGSPQHISGLIAGVNYGVIIRAVNDAGAGPASTALAATYVTSPDPPTDLTGVAGNQGVALAWTAPSATGGRALVSYTATATPGGASCTVLAPVTSCDITGLTNGVNYTFRVNAVNNIGTSSSSLTSTALKPVSPSQTETTFEIVIDVVVGDPVTGGLAEFSSSGLEPSSPWSLVVHSTPQLLSSGTAGAAGTILGNTVIPYGLEAGWHALTLSGIDYRGLKASSTTWFEINARGELIGSSGVDPSALPGQVSMQLAKTGINTSWYISCALLMLFVGTWMIRRVNPRT
ncbi:hypothetical protein M2119_000232 [Aurantimicrobium minutum]|nr:hypothetical protein [Aurantimicrobium minutum]